MKTTTLVGHASEGASESENGSDDGLSEWSTLGNDEKTTEGARDDGWSA